MIDVVLPAGAAEPPERLVGIALDQIHQPYRVDGSEQRWFPALQYEGERFYIEDHSAGYRFYKQGKLTVALTGNMDLLRYQPEHASTGALRQLDQRKESLTGGIEADVAIAPGATASLSVSHGIGNTHKSWVTELQMSQGVPLEAIDALAFGYVTLDRLPRRFTAYYFGIDVNESARSGLSVFNPMSTRALSLGLGMEKKIQKQWTLSGLLELRHYGDAIGASPLVGQRHMSTVEVGLMHSF